jgi:nucleotide-binding universal stress UspA family protein
MSGYKTVVVGTDGSDSSLRAVDRAGQLASGPDAKVIVASAYLASPEDTRAADLLKNEGYKMAGTAPIYELLHDARDRATAAGALAHVDIKNDLGFRHLALRFALMAGLH